MASIEKSIDVHVPLHTAYNQWTQFEEFPRFMEGIESVKQLDAKKLHWRANIAGKEKEWDAEIVDQVPDQRVSWRSLDGTPNDGTVTFQSLDADSTRVMLSMDYEPEGFVENVGSALGLASGRVEGDLQRFKEFIETRGTATGAWRGEIHDDQTVQTATTTQRATTTSAPVTTTTQVNDQGQTVLPVIEEELKVGKREVDRGGVRVTTTVEERPVEEQVSLREEHVTVERHPVDRPVTDADMAAFKESSLELTEMAEEAVVSKQARVIEEVVIDKDVQERTETVRDTVRRTDVDVQQIEGQTRTTGTTTTSFDAYDSDFRNNYQTTYAKSGYTYEQYAPVYQYGYALGTDSRYNGDWSTVETRARSRWEERNPGTWEQFKDAIHYAWERARGTTA